MAFVFDSLQLGFGFGFELFAFPIRRALPSLKWNSRKWTFVHFLVLIFPWLFILSHSASFTFAAESAGIDLDGGCGQLGSAGGSGWTEYKDEKCVKIIGVGTQGEGQLSCLPQSQTLGESLLQVSDGQEQDFVNQLILETSREKYENLSIWLSSPVRVNRNLQEDSGTGTGTGDDDKPEKDKSTSTTTTEGPEEANQKRRRRQAQAPPPSSNCMQIESFSGEQKETTCYKPNLVVCQKPVRWTYAHWNALQNSIVNSAVLAVKAKEDGDAVERNLATLKEAQEEKAAEAEEKAQKCTDEFEALRDQLVELTEGVANLKETHRNIRAIKNDLDLKYTELEDKFKKAAYYFVAVKDKVIQSLNGEPEPKPKPKEKPKTKKKPTK